MYLLDAIKRARAMANDNGLCPEDREAIRRLLEMVDHSSRRLLSAVKGELPECLDCKEPYPFGLDLVLPNQQWEHLCPTDGILCPTCICKRAEKLEGSSVLLTWIDQIDWNAPRPAEWGSRSHGPRGLRPPIRERSTG